MSNPSKRRGSAWETRVRDYLRTQGFDAERLPSEGAKDRGDIAGVPYVLECKAVRREDLAEAMKEARREAENAGKPGYAVVRPNRGKPVAEAFATVPLWLLATLMREDVPLSADAELRQISDLLTPTEHTELYEDLAEMARTRRRAEAAAGDIPLP